MNSAVFCFDVPFYILQVEYSTHSYASSNGEDDDDATQESMEDRKYPGEVTTTSFKVKFQPKDCKKEVLL